MKILESFHYFFLIINFKKINLYPYQRHRRYWRERKIFGFFFLEWQGSHGNWIERELLRTLENRKKKWLGHIMRGDSLYYITHYQDCPIDFHILHSELFHDHVLVPQTITWLPRALRVRLHNTHVSYVCRAKCRVRYSKIRTRSMN